MASTRFQRGSFVSFLFDAGSTRNQHAENTEDCGNSWQVMGGAGSKLFRFAITQNEKDLRNCREFSGMIPGFNAVSTRQPCRIGV
jgi:hypothetical protein